MNTTLRSILLALAAAAALAAVTLFVIFRFFLPLGEKQDTDFDPRYVIGNWEGQVAVFEGDDSYPMQVYDVYITALPEEEQNKVNAGIPVSDETQLSLLLEDYTS